MLKYYRPWSGVKAHCTGYLFIGEEGNREARDREEAMDGAQARDF